MRIQFYPGEELEKRLNYDAEEFNISVSTLVNDLLNKHYGLVPATSLTNAELRNKIYAEIAVFVDNQEFGREFDLNEASETYRSISMVYAGKPSVVRAQIGKEFNNKYVGLISPFKKVRQVKLENGNVKRTVNRAAIYVVCEEEVK